LSHGHARTSLLLHLLFFFFFFFFFFFSFLRSDDVRSLRIQSGGSISHNAIPPKVYDSRNWRISRSSSSSCAATSPRSAVRSRRIVERRRGVKKKKKKKKKKMEASLTTGEIRLPLRRRRGRRNSGLQHQRANWMCHSKSLYSKPRPKAGKYQRRRFLLRSTR
jgi:hypothetical protein